MDRGLQLKLSPARVRARARESAYSQGREDVLSSLYRLIDSRPLLAGRFAERRGEGIRSDGICRYIVTRFHLTMACSIYFQPERKSTRNRTRAFLVFSFPGEIRSLLRDQVDPKSRESGRESGGR